MNNELKIAFWGTPNLCIPYLDKLSKVGLKPVVIITNPDRPVGRKQTLTTTPVKIWAKENDVIFLTPEKIDRLFLSELSEYDVDLSIVVAYGKILPEEAINLPIHGTLNVHYSLLPRWRGASPVEATILAGDTETGVSIQKMVSELDAGDIISDAKIDLSGDEFAPDLKTILSEIGSDLLIETVPEFLNGNLKLRKQDNMLVSKCKTIKKEQGELLESDSDEMKWRKYRAYFDWPGVFYFKEGKRIKVTEAEYTNEGEFLIKKVIREGGKEISL